MPNWCKNEINFYVRDWKEDSIPEALRIRQILEFMRETDEAFGDRLKAMRVLDRQNKTNHYYQHRDQHAPYVFDFNSIKPYPEIFRQMDRDHEIMTQEEYAKKYPDANKSITGKVGDYYYDGFNSGGYQWCNRNWGTKWGAVAPVWVPLLKTMFFDTAWSPVMEIVGEIHKRFPDVLIRYEYYEAGSGYMGGCEFIPESSWDASDISSKDTYLIEKKMKEGIDIVDDLKWEAGKPYNEWSHDYGGYKGG